MATLGFGSMFACLRHSASDRTVFFFFVDLVTSFHGTHGSTCESLCVRSFQLQRAVATGRPASLSRGSSLPSPGQTDERRVRGPRSCRRCPAAFAECGADAGQSLSVFTLPPCALWSLRAHRPCQATRSGLLLPVVRSKNITRSTFSITRALYPFWCGGAPTPFL